MTPSEQTERAALLKRIAPLERKLRIPAADRRKLCGTDDLEAVDIAALADYYRTLLLRNGA